MHTPSTALAWELWRRHRPRLIAIGGLLLGFIFVYPKLCALAGVDLANSDDLVSFSGRFRPDPNPLYEIAQCLYFLFLVAGPELAMFLSLLCLTWMFTFLEFHPNTKDPARFPTRLFTLPVSTGFLFSWLFLGGLAALGLIVGCWRCFVVMPRVLAFDRYHGFLVWWTLLVLAQAITWSLAAWPNTRLCVLAMVFFCFMTSPGWGGYFHSPVLLPGLFVGGAILARAGLEKMRHGQWQAWKGPLPFQSAFAGRRLRGPQRFASPAQAQLWFEWRRFARTLCIGLAAFALVPILLHVLVRLVAGFGPVQTKTLVAFAILLAVVPPAIHFCFTVATVLREQSFAMLRPITNGEMVMATLKATAMSAAFSWLAVGMALLAMSFLGNVHEVEQSFGLRSAGWTMVALLCMAFLTWRIAVVELCFVMASNRWMAAVPWLKLFAFWGGAILFNMEEDKVKDLTPVFPYVLAGLVAVKLGLAWFSFGLSVRRRLLRAGEVLNYLGVWALLVGALVTLVVVLPSHEPNTALPLSVIVVLLVPLARVGFAPIALAQRRHE